MQVSTEALFVELNDGQQEVVSGGVALPFIAKSYSNYAQFQLGTTNNSTSGPGGTTTGSTTNVNNIFTSGGSRNNLGSPYISMG